MWKRIGITFSFIVWLAITLLLNVQFDNQTVITVSRVGSIQALRVVQALLNIIWFLPWLVVFKLVTRNDTKLKSDLVNVAVRIGILSALLIAFILGQLSHVLLIFIEIAHYTTFGILLFYGITYFICFVFGIWYVIVNTSKLGWKRTLRNGLIGSFIIGFIIVAILGIPISQ